MKWLAVLGGAVFVGAVGYLVYSREDSKEHDEHMRKMRADHDLVMENIRAKHELRMQKMRDAAEKRRKAHEERWEERERRVDNGELTREAYALELIEELKQNLDDAIEVPDVEDMH